jgi:hypothetical protein
MVKGRDRHAMAEYVDQRKNDGHVILLMGTSLKAASSWRLQAQFDTSLQDQRTFWRRLRRRATGLERIRVKENLPQVSKR